METEWDDIREQIKKGYQRIEKANQRAERRIEDPDPIETTPGPSDPANFELAGFAKKLAQMNRGS